MGQNEMTEGAGVNLILSKKFGVVGAPSPLMASEIFPNVILQNDRPEWPFLEGDKIAGGFIQDAGVAAQISHVGLHNPADSGILVVVQSILVDITGGDTRIDLGVTPDATDTLTTGTPRDTRFEFRRAGGPETTALLFTLTQVGTITATQLAQLTHNVSSVIVPYKVPIVLGPDGFVMVRGVGTNQAVGASFNWVEQKAASGELQGIRR